MNASHSLLTELANLIEEWKVLRLSHFDVLSAAAVRMALQRATGPKDVVVVDIRKMHDLNTVLGREGTDRLIKQLIQYRTNDPARPIDIAGQWGGDEFVFVVPCGDGAGLIGRLLYEAAALTKGLTPAQRAELRLRTGGLIDGLNIACVLVKEARDLTAAVAQGIEGTNVLKAGRITGERSTSGSVGNQTGWMRAA